MPQVQRTTVIDVDIDEAFALVADQPERMAEWWPPIERQARVTPAPTALGSVSSYVYNMLGIRIKGQHTVQAFERNERIFVKTTSGIDSSFDFRFAPESDGTTRLTVTVNYQLPGSIISQLLNRVMIEDANIRSLEQGLDNLKRLLEQVPQSVSASSR